MKFGTLYSYWSKTWACSPEHYLTLVSRVADIGFDVLEISADHLFHMSRSDILRLRDHADTIGIGFSINSGPSRAHDLASADTTIRDQGVAYFEVILDKMALLGAPTIAGAIYSFWPDDFATTDRNQTWPRSIASLKRVASHARSHQIDIALEVLNRNESHILNTSQEAVSYCDLIGSPHIGILLDTFHMNIEEDDMISAIHHAKEKLFHFHVGENNRKLPGMNNTIAWRAVGKALNDIGYDRSVVMEPFMLCGGEVGESIRVWRDLTDNADEAKMTETIRQSLAFLKDSFKV